MSASRRLRSELLDAFQRLDERLALALADFDAANGGPVTERLRGLVVTREQCATLLRSGPGTASPAPGTATTALWPPEEGSTAARLAAMFSLDTFDLDVLLVSLACEFDLRYERLFAYLQDDVTRKRPSVDLVLTLVCGEGARLESRARFAANAPLRRHRLIELLPDPQAFHPPLLSHGVHPDAQLVRWILGFPGLDERLASACTLEAAPQGGFGDLHIPVDACARLEAWARQGLDGAAARFAWLWGPAGGEGLSGARALARARGQSLLRLDAARVPVDEAEHHLRIALREAWFGCSLLCVERVGSWTGEPLLGERIAARLVEASCDVVLLSTGAPVAPLDGMVCAIELPMPDAAQRERCWAAALATMPDGDLAATAARLASSYRLMPAQIIAAVAAARLRGNGTASLQDLRSAARAQCGDALGAVSSKVEARATWDDIVLPAVVVSQLRELCTRVEQSDQVLRAGGFCRRQGRGHGTAALFSGGSGTGKTMAAEVIANALELDLYRIDLARVVSKYIGETEKNLDRVFDAAEGANAILLFDEADALFGKRSDVKDAHDRYANIEVSYLLQKMEEYQGVAILATNLADNLDGAFTRRLAFAIHFPQPDEATRLEIWRRAWPPETPVAPDVDRRLLARELKIAGGGIRNIALGAAFAASADGRIVDERHVALAVQREYQKTGCTSALPPRFAAQAG